MPVVTNLWKVKMENCTAWKSGTVRKSSLNLVTNQAKAKEEWRVKLTENDSAVGALVTSEQIAEPELTSMRDPKICAQVGKCWKLRGRRNRNLTKSAIGTIDVGSFEVLSDHGDEVDDDESTYDTKEMMPPLPPDSWFKRTETLCGKFRKPCNEDHGDEEDPFLDCWDGKQEQFDVLQNESDQAQILPMADHTDWQPTFREGNERAHALTHRARESAPRGSGC